jgi:hypothetical protein
LEIFLRSEKTLVDKGVSVGFIIWSKRSIKISKYKKRSTDQKVVGSTPDEISAKVFEQTRAQTNQKAMQPQRENQPTFFDLAVQQRGATNRVLETIAHEVDFRAAETRVASTYREGGRPACRVGVLLRVMCSTSTA